MKKLLAIFWLILPTILLAQTEILPERSIEFVSNGVIVTYQFANPVIHPNSLVPNTFFWQYPGFGINDKSGEPAVPFRNDLFYVPANHAAIVNIIEAEYTDTAFMMSPAVPNLPEISIPFVIDSISPYVGFFPSATIEADTMQHYRGAGLQEVTIMPVQYDNEHHIARVYTTIKYRVNFIPEQAASPGGNTPTNTDIIEEDFLSNITLNYGLQSGSNRVHSQDSIWHSSLNNQSLLIVTTNEYLDSIQNFVEWKRMKGNRVYVTTKNRGTWTTNEVQDSVENYFQQYGLQYLLIIGGVDDIPAIPFSFTYINDNQQTITINAVTDVEYGLPVLDAEIPQISRGRIPADNSHQVSVILDKVIQYERNPIIDSLFYHTALHCGKFQDEAPKDGYEDWGFILTSENIRRHLQSKGLQISRQYAKTTNTSPSLYWSNFYSLGMSLPVDLQPDSFLWDGNSTQIRSIIDSGTLYVLHNGHGYKEGWLGPFFNSAHISQLNNGNKYPVVFSINCRTGKYNETGDCFAEAFLKKEGGGCVGVFAATETSFTGYNDAMALGMFDAIWPNLQPHYHFIFYRKYSNISTPIYELGRILDQGLIRMGETFGKRMSNYKRETWKLFHCFGDPTMQIWTDTPQNFAEPLVFLRNDSIFVHVEDGDCKITFYDKATENAVSYKGNYAGYANPSDSLVICLDRHNYIPYIWDYSKDVYIQNENIEGEVRFYKGNTIHIGNHVTNTKNTGDVNIQNSTITIIGKQLDLQSGVYIESNFEFTNQ